MESILSQMTSLEAVLVGVVVVSWVAVMLAMISLVKVKRQEAVVRASMQELKRTVDIGNSGLMGMGRKLLSIEKNMQRVKRQVPEAQPASKDTSTPDIGHKGHYRQADTLLAQGLSVAQVASTTGMSQAEINLLALLKQAALAESH